MPGYTESTIGIVWQCQLCKHLIALGVTQIAYLALSDNANFVLDNPWPQSDRQCQLCRQCLLCRGPTMPFVQTMPIMRVGHSVPKVKLSSCQFPLSAYLALSMALCVFKICFWSFMLQEQDGTVGWEGMEGSYPLDCQGFQSTCSSKNIYKSGAGKPLLVQL